MGIGLIGGLGLMGGLGFVGGITGLTGVTGSSTVIKLILSLVSVKNKDSSLKALWELVGNPQADNGSAGNITSSQSAFNDENS